MINIKSIMDTAFSVEIQSNRIMQLRGEAIMMASFLSAKRPTHIMEIGGFMGASFYVWCGVLRNRTGKKIMVDRIDDLQRYKLDKKGVEERNRWIQSFSSGAFIIERNSHDPETKERIKNILGNDELDFLFIDGDHTYEGAKKDYEMYSEYVKKGGVIAFHDINETELHKSQNCRVYKLWQELTGEKLIFSQNQVWGGIGVLIK